MAFCKSLLLRCKQGSKCSLRGAKAERQAAGKGRGRGRGRKSAAQVSIWASFECLHSVHLPTSPSSCSHSLLPLSLSLTPPLSLSPFLSPSLHPLSTSHQLLLMQWKVAKQIKKATATKLHRKKAQTHTQTYTHLCICIAMYVYGTYINICTYVYVAVLALNICSVFS